MNPASLPNTSQACHGLRLSTLLRKACAPLLIALLGLGICASTSASECVHKRPARHTDFAILSDLHVYDTSLGTTGEAFEASLRGDPKLHAWSEAILDSALNDIIHSGVRFVIISGDLTKDGELASHLKVLRKLRRLERAGVQVYVVPGNHDINNHDAAAYSGTSATPVPSINASGFKKLYHDFGYAHTVSTAPDSLSYVAEPVPGLWLVAIDSVRHEENATSEHPIIAGRITNETLAWAQQQIRTGRARGKKIMAFMHHGVNLHFLSQPVLFPDYLVENWPVVGAKLAGAGLEVIFTGHYHSLDISALTVDSTGTPTPSSLTDIETSSLASWPCAYRVASLDHSGLLSVESRQVTSIKADLGGVNFRTFAQNFSRQYLPHQVSATLQALFALPEAQAQGIAPIVVEALMANYAGDEDPSLQTLATIEGLLQYPVGSPYNTLGQLLGTLWFDPSCPDGAAKIQLTRSN